MWLEVLLTSREASFSLLWFHLSPGCIYGLRAGAEPGAPGSPALPPWPQAHSGTIFSFQAA